jgi:hypothetical protein
MRMTQGLLGDAEHWLDRANEARIQAEQMRDPDARRELLHIVAGYIRMAVLATERRDHGKRLSSVDRLN